VKRKARAAKGLRQGASVINRCWRRPDLFNQNGLRGLFAQRVSLHQEKDGNLFAVEDV